MRRSFNGIDYYLIDPTGNITILVESYVPVPDQPYIANMLMEHEPECEQVGFMGASKIADIGLRMAAGEFCGNAVMSAAALYCYKAELPCDKDTEVKVECSGCDKPVLVNITCDKDPDNNRRYKGSVFMPKHKSIEQYMLTHSDKAFDLPVVDMGGIFHIIAEAPLDLTDEDAEQAVKKWCSDLNAEALGLMQLRSFSENELELRPLVYVPAVGTCFWESSCASGTTAAGVYLANRGRAVSDLCVHEPGGELMIDLFNGQIILSGVVNIT